MARLAQYRALTLAAFCAVIAALLVVVYWREMEGISHAGLPGLLLRMESSTKDGIQLRGRKTPENPDLVYIGVDAASMNLDGVSPEEIAASPALTAMKEGWPWNRSVHGMILDRLAAAGARVVIFDLLFPNARPGDEEFKEALSKWGNRAVLAYNFDFDPSRESRMILSFPSKSIIPSDAPNKTRIGYANYFPDTDGVVRRTKCQLVFEDIEEIGFDQDSKIQDSLMSAALRQLGRKDLIPGRDPVAFRYTGAAGTFHARPAFELFVPSMWKGNYHDGDSFKGKIVIVGPVGGFGQDQHRVAVGDKDMDGPEIHLHVLNALLHKEFLTETSALVDVAVIAFAALAAWLISAAVRQPGWRFLALAIVSASFLAILIAIYNRFGLLTATTTPLLALNASGGICMIYDFVLERMEKGRFRRTLERYVSKNVVKEILDNPESYITTLGGMRRPVALLFTDLRGFTTLTEAADSVQLVKQLNEYFTEMVKPVFANDGTLDKFIGDAIMAVWGNVTSRGAEHDVKMAVKTALEMKHGLARLNEKWRAEGVGTLAMGIGVNHGTVVAGEIGSSEKKEITVIGDAVNLASRIEGLTKEYHVEILLGEEASSEIRDHFYLQSVDLVQVKGKTKPVKVSTVHGMKPDPLPETLREYLQRYEESLEMYWARRFDAAAKSFEECQRLKPNDYLSEMYRKRCLALLQTPPDETWDGVFVMHEK